MTSSGRVSGLRWLFGLICWMAAALSTSIVAAGSVDEDGIFVCGFECDASPAVVTLRTYEQSYESGGMGVPWGVAAPDRVFQAGNMQPSPTGPIDQFRVRAWSFSAPTEALTGAIYLPPMVAGVVTAISSCPADFDQGQQCRVYGGNTQLRWSTDPDRPNACLLEPGRTYFLHSAHFSLSAYVNSGDISSTCGCPSPPCAGCVLAYSPQTAR